MMDFSEHKKKILSKKNRVRFVWPKRLWVERELRGKKWSRNIFQMKRYDQNKCMDKPE
jgi:hypothetical protein